MATLADIHLQLLPGTDGAGFGNGKHNCKMKVGMIKISQQYFHGFEEYKEYIKEFTPEKVEEVTAVPKEL